MFLGLLTLITALSISAVAIYYSVAGLVAIFAAAALPIMIMGGTLEVAKLVTAVWLHRYWTQATWWLKTYLATAVVVLMFITSMGIFGFLSKAHIEQTSASQESVARSEVLQQEIDRQIAIVGRSENQIRQLESTGTGSDANIQAQINAEQERIDKAYERVQPAIDEQQRIINNQGKIFRDELARIDEQLATLQRYIDAGEIKKAQQMVGAKADGAFGPNTAAKFREWQEAQQVKRTELLTKIEGATNNPQARAAANEIKRLRQTVETQIADSNRLINRLRTNIGKTDNSANIQKSIDEQNERIRIASSEIEKLTQEKIAIDSEYRKLEAEVGPIKYIAEFIYGSGADNNMLEEAVRWVIIIIIFVFDPLAVLLLIASQYTFEYHRRNKDDRGGWLRQWREYEQARAQRIVDNPGFTPSTPVPETAPDVQETHDEDTGREDPKEAEQVDTSLPEAQPEETVEAPAESDPVVVTEESVVNEIAQGYIVEDTTNEKKIERVRELEEKEKDDSWTEAKNKWKEEHPQLTLKHFKNLYVEGKIDELPWESYVEKKTYIMKEDETQITRETKPQFTEVIEPEGYIQNSEQNDNTLWNRLNKRD